VPSWTGCAKKWATKSETAISFACGHIEARYNAVTGETAMATPTTYAHIEIRDDGRAWLIGTQTKVLEVALNRIAYHWDGDEIQRGLPFLTLGQIYSCLAYYHDHQAELDAVIEAQLETTKRLRAEQGESPIHAKLKAKGLAS
jgi:uncharacterized protein (DUF433 family)